MEINRPIALTDKVACTGAVTLGGTLNLTITGTPQAGDQFTLFTGTSFSGAFSSIVPATPGDGLKWTMANGVLKVDPLDGVERIENSRVRIYPNPASDRTEISLDKVYNNIIVTIESANGTMLQTSRFTGLSQMNLDLSSLPKGFYLIRTHGDDELNTVTKVLKK